MIRIFTVAALVVAPLATSANAVTIDMRGIVNVIGDQDSDFFNASALQNAEAGNASASSPGFGAQGSYNVSADARTGQLRFSLQGQETGFGSASLDAFIRMTETLTVTGTGRLTAQMQVDADWTTDAQNFNFVSSLQFATANSNMLDQISLGKSIDPNVGSVDQLLELSMDFDSAVARDILFAARLSGDIGASSSDQNGQPTPTSQSVFMDASNTATFNIFASDGLSFTASDQGFLSDPALGAGPAVIPTPAALPLLLTGFGMLGLATRSRRTRARVA